MGDLNSRRGRVSGMDMRGEQQSAGSLSEMLDYQSKLNSIDAGSRFFPYAVFACRCPANPLGESRRTGAGGRAGVITRATRQIKVKKVKN